jgi:hypothetical protein
MIVKNFAPAGTLAPTLEHTTWKPVLHAPAVPPGVVIPDMSDVMIVPPPHEASGGGTQARSSISHPDKFSGRPGERLDTALFHFNNYLTLSREPKGSWATVAAAFLAGAAKQAFEEHAMRVHAAENRMLSWDELITTLRATFPQHNVAHRARAEFWDCTQASMTVEGYAAKLKQLASRCSPPVRAEDVLVAFTKGLQRDNSPINPLTGLLWDSFEAKMAHMVALEHTRAHALGMHHHPRHDRSHDRSHGRSRNRSYHDTHETPKLCLVRGDDDRGTNNAKRSGGHLHDNVSAEKVRRTRSKRTTQHQRISEDDNRPDNETFLDPNDAERGGGFHENEPAKKSRQTRSKRTTLYQRVADDARRPEY